MDKIGTSVETAAAPNRDDMVQRAQAGDREAYGELVRRFGSLVYAVAVRRLGNPAEAEEVAQDVFAHSLTKLGQLRDPRCFPGWLRQIAVRLTLARISRRRPLPDVRTVTLDEAPAREANPLDQLIRSEEQGRVRETLKELKPLDREMLEAFYLRSRTLRQMSRDFSAPVGTIKRRLHMARNRLRKQLTDGQPGPA